MSIVALVSIVALEMDIVQVLSAELAVDHDLLVDVELEIAAAVKVANKIYNKPNKMFQFNFLAIYLSPLRKTNTFCFYALNCNIFD